MYVQAAYTLCSASERWGWQFLKLALDVRSPRHTLQVQEERCFLNIACLIPHDPLFIILSLCLTYFVHVIIIMDALSNVGYLIVLLYHNVVH